jgi:protein arginine kinase
MRLAVDFGLFPVEKRAQIDRLAMEVQPGHVQCTTRSDINPEERDKLRAKRIREQFASFPILDFNNIQWMPTPQRKSDNGTDE